MQPLRDRLDRAVEHMMHAGREALKTRKQWLMEQQSSLAQIEPAGRVRLAQQRTQAVARRLITAVTTRLTAGHVRVDAMARQLDALGPRNVLKRGYSYTQGPDGKLLRRVEDAHAGDRIITTLVDGRVTSRVEEGSKRRRGGQKSKSKTSGADGAGQLGLFE
jgi:exodeoxyribonuclease VII large subunit